ncbi:MAG: cytochrome c-type biogenesis protein CcmH [Micropepsaceae bacterium]
MRRLILLLAAVAMMGWAAAYEPGEALDDPALEARARALSKELRCLVCQNESIDDSAAPLARDLRMLVRERLLAGDSDQQVLDHIVARYGEFVLLRPPVRPGTWLLWFGPFAAVVLGGAIIAWRVRRRPQAVAAAVNPELSDDEERRLRDIVNG